MGDLVVMPRKAQVVVVLRVQVFVRPGYGFATNGRKVRFKAIRVEDPHIELEAVDPGSFCNVGAGSITDMVYPTYVPNCVEQAEAATGGSGSTTNVIRILEDHERS